MSDIPRCSCCDVCGGPSGQGSLMRCSACENELQDEARATLDAVRADLSRVTGERDEAQAQLAETRGEVERLRGLLAKLPSEDTWTRYLAENIRYRAALEPTEENVEAVAEILADTFGRHFKCPRVFGQMPRGAQEDCRIDARAVLTAIARSLPATQGVSGGRDAVLEEAVDCVAAEARDCGCSARIEARIRALKSQPAAPPPERALTEADEAALNDAEYQAGLQQHPEGPTKEGERG